MLSANEDQRKQDSNILEPISETTVQQKPIFSSAPKSVLHICVYLILRILYSFVQRIIMCISLFQTYDNWPYVILTILPMFIGVLLPIVLLFLLLSKRNSFLIGMIIISVLDGIVALQILHSIIFGIASKNNITVSAIIGLFFSLASIIIAIFANHNKAFRSYCSNTPSHDRKNSLDTKTTIAEKNVRNLVGIHGWLALFALFLCLVTLSTVSMFALSLNKMNSTFGTYHIILSIGQSLIIGLIFYIFPLISLIRLFQRRLVFRNSYLTGTIIYIVLMPIVIISPDGKALWPYIPFILIMILLMIIWTFYLFRSKRVLLSCIKVKQSKTGRVDGLK